MIVAKHSVKQILKISNIARQVSSLKSAVDLKLKPKFTPEEQQRILNILNESDSEQLSKFNILQNSIKYLQKWKVQKGPFQSLNEMLDVEGLGLKGIERLCSNIATYDESKAKIVNGKNRKNILTPNLSVDQINALNFAVSVHLNSSGISWAKISCANNELLEWNFFDFSLQPKKMLPTDTFNLAVSILPKIPLGDIYVFEACPNLSPQSQKQPAMIISYNQHLELNSMLLALINTSSKHAVRLDDAEDPFCNKVHYLKSKLPARLFKTLVGNEKVSTTTTINNLLYKSSSSLDLPCTPIKTNELLKEQYTAQTPIIRELLGHALMLVITFMDICVYKNPSSINAISLKR